MEGASRFFRSGLRSQGLTPGFARYTRGVQDRRLVSLDVFRGLTVAAMVLVNNPGTWRAVYAPLRHADWHGWTPTDLIFPFFLFIVGVAIPLGLGRRLEAGERRGPMVTRIVRRAVVIFVLGLTLHAVSNFDLATVVALMARERGGPALAHQVLIYPVTKHGLDTPSYHENATGYVLTREAMRWFWRHYLERAEQGVEPHASPLLAPSLAGLPPALVITAECDPLRDEGEAYAARLRDAGVPVTLTRYGGMFHGFFRMTRLLDKAKAALDEVAGSLRKAWGQALTS